MLADEVGTVRAQEEAQQEVAMATSALEVAETRLKQIQGASPDVDFQIIVRRNVLCGMHIHVAVPADVDRVELMNRLMHWLPAFLALSTSSPFSRLA